MSGSDFTAGVIIVAGEPTADSVVVACGPDGAAVRGDAGTTYYVMAFSDTVGVIGGNLVADFSALPPAPEATLTVEPRATAYKDGSLLLRGTYSCTNADGYSSDVEGTVTQTVGRTKIEGFFFVYPLECDGDVHPWEAIVTSSNGLFAGGKATSRRGRHRVRCLRLHGHRGGPEAPGDARRPLSAGSIGDGRRPPTHEGGGRGDQPRSPLSASADGGRHPER